jgi:hypothetical protein
MDIVQIFGRKNQKKIETPQTKENAFYKTVLYMYLFAVQNYMKQSSFLKCCPKNSLDLNVQ